MTLYRSTLQIKTLSDAKKTSPVSYEKFAEKLSLQTFQASMSVTKNALERRNPIKVE